MSGNSVDEMASIIEPIVRKVVLEEMEQVTKRVTKHVTLTILKHFNVTPRTSLDQAETSEGRSCQLRFANKLPTTIFTDSKIEVEIGEPVKIELIDTISKAPVTSGPDSSKKIQILVLDGDFGFEDQENWTEQEFNSKVVHEREGKRPLVTGELNITLRDGVGIISDLSFTDNSSWIKCRKFRLGARVVQSVGGQVRIKEAISKAFLVKDHRTKKYRKHHPPSLDDKVWRLEKIRKDGKFHQQLASHQIETVKDFMRMYVTDPTKLREMLDCPEGAWNTIVEHASTCAVVDDKFYAYSVEGIGLLFNSIYMLVAATFDGHNYQSLDKLSVFQKSLVESKKEQAYKNVNNFDPADGLAIFSQSKSLTSLQDEPISGSTTGLQLPEFPVAEQGSAEMHIDCHRATTSSFYMGGSENHCHQLQLPVAENTHLIQEFDPMFGNYNFGMDEFFLSFNGETVPNLASEMTSQAPMSTWPPVNDSEFGHVANTHGMQQAMSTRSPLTSAISGNNNGQSVPIGDNSEFASLLNTDHMQAVDPMPTWSPGWPARDGNPGPDPEPTVMMMAFNPTMMAFNPRLTRSLYGLYCYTGGTSLCLKRENDSALYSTPISNNSELASFSNTHSIKMSTSSLIITFIVVILVRLALFPPEITLNWNCPLRQDFPVSLLVVFLVGLIICLHVLTSRWQS